MATGLRGKVADAPEAVQVSCLSHRGRCSYVCAVLCAGALCSAGRLQAEAPAPGVPLQEVSRTEFGQHIALTEAVVRACRADAKGCSGDIGPDNKVQADGAAPAFTEHFDWLRDALVKSLHAKPQDRTAAMDSAYAHLEELNVEAHTGADAATKARREAEFNQDESLVQRVLARSEFRAARGPTWLEREWARFLMWLGDLFDGVGRLTSVAPWVGTLLEWTFFLAAAVGLLLFVLRSFARQRLRIAMNPSAVQASAWDREATDWATEAEASAARGAWREAVHCLYWASIVRLEARRAWRHDPARTPREYVRLLKPGSPQQSALRGLTGIFERVWYGLREAHAEDYRRARALFEGLNETATVNTAQAERA